MRHINPDVMPLGEQIAHLAIISTVSAWISWLWTHEEVFRDIQDYLKSKLESHKAQMKKYFHQRPRPYGRMVKHWAIQKACFGLTCQTCFVHYPALLFTLMGHYRLVETGNWGTLYAWMFVAFTGDSILWLLGVMRKGQRLEEATGEALEAGATLLKRKVQKDETADVAPTTDGGSVKTVSRIQRDGIPERGTGVEMPTSGPRLP